MKLNLSISEPHLPVVDKCNGQLWGNGYIWPGLAPFVFRDTRLRPDRHLYVVTKQRPDIWQLHLGIADIYNPRSRSYDDHRRRLMACAMTVSALVLSAQLSSAAGNAL
jgi:hypothetical protein